VFLLAAVAAALALYWRTQTPAPPVPDPSPPPPTENRPTAAQAPSPTRAQEPPGTTAQPPSPAPVATDARAVAAALPAPRPEAGAAAQTEPDEEAALLERTELDADKKVIGEEPEARVTRSESRNHPVEAPVVSVKIVTRPEGAVIRLKERVFGRAPMNLRFRPGVPFDLSFVKTGYVTKTKRFTFAKRKNQSVTVVLAKRPEKKKSFFRRLFGG
jgi:hypothetical protein